MEIVKRAREVGTSAGVILPRSWLNKEVVVTLLYPTKQKMLMDVVELLVDKDLNDEIKGVYLYGSHARGDNGPGSDIDILVITSKVSKLIKQDNYEILLVSEKDFALNLSKNLAYISALKEAKPLLNRELLEQYREKSVVFNSKIYIDEIKSVIKINEEAVLLCKENDRKVPDGIIYSVVLRLRELYLIKLLQSRKTYSLSEFLKNIPEKMYSSYLRVKRDESELKTVSPDEVMPLIDLSKKWLKELKG